MPLNLPLIVRTILDEYALPWDGDHGVAHWARVLENGLRLTEVTGANVEVVQLFAVFHDSKRVKETTEFQHGRFGVWHPALRRSLPVNQIVADSQRTHFRHIGLSRQVSYIGEPGTRLV
jgi:hypothetical protein